MSPISVGLDILLIGLLGVALVIGLRLNRKLKALRDGQEGFVAAVKELDGAAARAEAGLAALRAASEDAHDALLTRIETARGLIAKLESATFDADRARDAAAPAAHAPAKPVQRQAFSRPVKLPDDELFEERPARRVGGTFR